jgi:hypothetical protein
MSDYSIDKWALYRHLVSTPNVSGAVQAGRVLTKEDCAAALAALPDLTAGAPLAMKKLHWGLKVMAGHKVPGRLAACAKQHGWRRRMDTVHYVGASATSKAQVVAMDEAFYALFREPMVRVLEQLHTARVAAEITHRDSEQPALWSLSADGRVAYGTPAPAAASRSPSAASRSPSAAARAGVAARASASPQRGDRRSESPVSPARRVYRASAAVSAEEDDGTPAVQGSPMKRRVSGIYFEPAGLKAAPASRDAAGPQVNLYDEVDSEESQGTDDAADEAAEDPFATLGWN